MFGIDPKMMVYQLNIDPTYRSVKQRKQSFIPELQKTIIEEVDKLVKARLIKKVIYPDWLANVVVVKKTNGK